MQGDKANKTIKRFAKVRLEGEKNIMKAKDATSRGY